MHIHIIHDNLFAEMLDSKSSRSTKIWHVRGVVDAIIEPRSTRRTAANSTDSVFLCRADLMVSCITKQTIDFHT